MGDIAELRGFIVVISFIGILILLLLWIPSEFYTLSEEQRQVSTPEYYEGGSTLVYNYSQTHSATVNYSGGTFEDMFVLGGHWQDITTFECDSDEIMILHLTTVWYLFIPWTEHHRMHWRDSSGIELATDDDQLNIAILDAHEYGEMYVIHCDHFFESAIFTYNQTSYTSYADAWSHDDLQLWLGITWDQQSTSVNAWNLVAMLLFFQLPGIHPIVNALLAIPIWACVAYLTFIFILRVIGAVFGGGGA